MHGINDLSYFRNIKCINGVAGHMIIWISIKGGISDHHCTVSKVPIIQMIGKINTWKQPGLPWDNVGQSNDDLEVVLSYVKRHLQGDANVDAEVEVAGDFATAD